MNKMNHKKINFLLLPFIMVMLQTTALFSQSQKLIDNQPDKTVPVLNIGPYLQDITQTSVVIMWETSVKTVGSVEYGDSPDHLLKNCHEVNAVIIHEIHLDSLDAGKRYYYKCTWENGQTPVYELKTMPLDGTGKLKIVAYGDSRSNPETHSKVALQIAASKPDLILFSGDFVMYGADVESWKPQFFDPIKPFSPEVPILTVLGNHEINSPYYNNLFVRNHNKTWWSVDYDQIHIIGLDTNQPGEPGNEQYNWLLEDLEKHKSAKWKIVMFHVPIFSTRPSVEISELRWIWHPLFQKYNVDLVISGDDHYYSRTFPIGKAQENPKGVVYLISAGGGAPLYPTISTEYTAYRRTINHFTELNFNNNQLNINAIDIDGNTFDYFTIHKNSVAGTESFFAYEMLPLEKEIRQSFNASDIHLKSETAEFNFKINIKSPFDIPVLSSLKLYPQAWNFDSVFITNSLFPGQDFILQLKGTFNPKNIRELPDLDFEVKARDTIIYSKAYNPLGFKNTRFTINLEEALYSSIYSGLSDGCLNALLFIHYFPESKYCSEIITRFWEVVKKEDAGNPVKLNLLHEISKKSYPNVESIEFYPVSFLLGDFSKWAEWKNKIKEIPVKDRSKLRLNLLSLPGRGIVNGGSLNKWFIAGVFDNPKDEGFMKAYPPEMGIKLTDEYKNFYGEKITWKKVKADEEGLVNFKNMFERNLEGVVYAYTEISAEKLCEVPILLGSDDGIVVWINGKEIYRYNEARGAIKGQDIILANFKKGKNKILVKVNQLGGGWGMYFDVLDKDKVLQFN